MSGDGGSSKRRHVRGFAEDAKSASVNLVESPSAEIPAEEAASSETTLSDTSHSTDPDTGSAPISDTSNGTAFDTTDATTSTISTNAPMAGIHPQKRDNEVIRRAWREQVSAVSGLFDMYCKDMVTWLWSLRAPIILLAALALVPKFIFLWILLVLAKPTVSWMLRHCPEHLKNNLRAHTPKVMRNSALLEHFSEGADQALPFILFWLYLCCAPFALCWMAVDWIKGLRRPQLTPMRTGEDADARFVFPQNRKLDSAQSDNNFYHSRAFGIVFLTFFALGIPAFFSLALYENLGVDKLVDRSPVVRIVNGNYSVPPKVVVPRAWVATKPKPHFPGAYAYSSAPSPNGPTDVVGYNGYWPWLRNVHMEPTMTKVFFLHFYLVSLASALCMLFFRAWFTFPLNFLSDEHDVEATASGIKRRNIKGWFLSVLTMNRWASGGGPDSLKWKEVKSLRYLEEGFTRLCPLPETAFKKESLSYKLLNKGAALIDGLSHRTNTANFLVFSVTEQSNDFGRNIKLNLNDLNRDQRARLFYAVKQWAPHVTIMKSAEEKLIGSTVLQDVRYTQLWFDLLTSKTRAERQSALTGGDTLKNSEFTIEERISAGGQATTYLARRASGDKCVLKEFILATSSSSGALIESAREFEAEVSLLSQLKHPGIVALEDYFCEDGRVYVVLEHIPGQSLRQMVAQSGALDQSEVVRIGQSICEVLEYLHTCNPPVVHRDITPENIIIQPDGTIKIIDFSLAVKKDGRQTTDSCAKQAFTPPEQFREEVSVQSDIYALGATMFYLLTGSNPKPISKSSPQLKAPAVVPKLNSIVERATELDLNQRYDSVNWLKLDLAQVSAELKEAKLDMIE